MNLLRKRLTQELHDALATIRNFDLSTSISFHRVWMIFNPESIVDTQCGSLERVSRILRTEIYMSKGEKQRFFVPHCGCVDFDGKRFGLARHIKAFVEYDGKSLVGVWS
jgi:hypothetical protein